MIPGTLRPLPKKLKEVKEQAEKLLKDVRYSNIVTEDIFANSSSYDYKQIRSQYYRLIDQYNDLLPILRDSERLLNKYVNDYLLNELVFKLYTDVNNATKKLDQDIQRLETMLMARRRKYIEEQIPYIHEQIKEKLSYMKNLSFEEIIKKGEEYSGIISEIMNSVSELRDEYQKLMDGSFDVTEMYAHLEDKITTLEESVNEYELILRTCKMELLKERAINILEVGTKLVKRFADEQSEDLLEDAQKYLDEAYEILDEMSDIKVDIPKKGFTREFIRKYKSLAEEFSSKQDELSTLVVELKKKTEHLGTIIDRIKAIKEILENGPYRFKKAAKLLRAKKKFSFKFALKFDQVPYFSLDEKDMVKILAIELTPEVNNAILQQLDIIDATPIFKELLNIFKTLNFKVIWSDIKNGTIKFFNNVKKLAKNIGDYFSEKIQNLKAKSKAKKERKRLEKPEGEDEEEKNKEN